MDPDTLRTELLSMGQPARNLGDFDSRRMGCVCETLKAFLKTKAADFIKSANHTPILAHYSSDCTPLQSRKRLVAKAGDTHRVRSGKSTDEYLVEQLFYRYLRSADEPATTVVLRDPLPLTSGKSSAALFTAGQKFIPTLRQQGHEGIAIHSYTFDRAAAAPLGRFFRAYHGALSRNIRTEEPGLTEELMAKEWILTPACAIHDAHNALKWSMHSFFTEPGLLENLYVSIQAVRQTVTQVFSWVNDWLPHVVEFVSDDSLPDSDNLRTLWSTLSVDPELIHPLCDELRLIYSGGKLLVHASCQSRPDLTDVLTTCLLGVWDIQQFTTSRWLTIGSSCRCLCASLLTGLPSLIEHARHRHGVSEFYMNGWDKLTIPSLRFAVVASLSSYVPETLLVQLLEDSRLPMQLEALRVLSLREELLFLDLLPDEVWVRLGSICSERAASLRSMVLRAAYVGVSYINNKTFKDAASLPWRLATGDIEANLAILRSEDQPVDEVSSRIWSLVSGGYPLAQVAQALRLVQDIPWGTSQVEQQHASATLMKKHHQEIGQNMLMMRSFFHSLRPLLQPHTEDPERVRHVQKLRKLLAKTPQKITGRHMYLKEMMTVAMQRQASGNNPLPPGGLKRLFANHGQGYKQLSAKRQGKYESQASIARSASAGSIQNEIEYEVGYLKLLADRKHAHTNGRPPLSLSCCRLFQNDVIHIAALIDDTSVYAEHWQEKRKNAMTAPPALSEDACQTLKACIPKLHATHRLKPDWMSKICWGRESCENTCWCFVDEGISHWFKFSYATQQPQFVSFLPLEMLEKDVQVSSHKHDEWEIESFAFAKRSFRLLGIDSVSWWEVPDVDDYYVSVLPACFHEPGGVVSSLADPVRLALFVEGLPGKPQGKRKLRDEDELRQVETKTASDVPIAFTAWLREEGPWGAAAGSNSSNPDAAHAAMMMLMPTWLIPS